MGVALNVFKEKAYFCHVPETETVHTLDKFASQSMLAKKCHKNYSLLISVGQHTHRSAIALPQQVGHNALKHNVRGMMRNDDRTFVLAHRQNRSLLHTIVYAFDESICKRHYMLRAAIVLGHLYKCAFIVSKQLAHIVGIGTAKLIDILVVISYSYHTHLLIYRHEHTHQCKFLRTHILRLINDKNRLADAVWFHFALANHPCSASHHIFCILQVAYSTEQVERIRMEGLYFYEVGSVAYKSHKALLELGCCCTREGKHEQLLVLHVFK